MEAQFLKYQKFFTDFSKLDKMEDTFVTFMELSGYPHFENVCSNILSFYFDTQQKHCLKDLAIKSLLQCVSEFDNRFGEVNSKEVHREYGIENLNRIDLVIDCYDFCVSIENKIFHWLHNDLPVYESEINKKFPYQKNYHIVLSLKKENVTGNFVSVTYEQFFNQLKSNLGHYSIDGNNTYIIYLLDFIKTIENHYKMEDVNKEMFHFLINNYETIKEIDIEKRKIDDLLSNLVIQISNQIPNIENSEKWIYQRYTIVHDFVIEGNKVAVDLSIDYKEVKMTLFMRSRNQDTGFLDKLQVVKNNIFFRENRYELYQKDVNFFDIDKEELAKTAYELLKQVKL